MSAPLRKTNGFTLLELLCALGLLSLVFGIALPRISAALPGLYLDQATRSLASEVQLARVKAISRNTRARVILQLDRGSYQPEVESEGIFTPEGTARQLAGGVTFDAGSSSRVSGGRITITFQPRGNTADNSTIALTSASGGQRRVIVSSAGRVRIE